ncbi:hypothetical protein [Wenzhouxiangella sp. EGI_FJ10305]|uniref:hypothetical protein n=1 Tax=Wenzhouxiangella sp. EGI_FJ10305 TaxID=3243768 RepID=UPI0035D9EFF7
MVTERPGTTNRDAGIFERLIGGLGLYGPRSHRGPFVHVDARGNAARWEVP